jgi:hypothetical protein
MSSADFMPSRGRLQIQLINVRKFKAGWSPCAQAWVASHKPFDEALFVPYRSVGFMSRNGGQSQTRVHIPHSALKINADCDDTSAKIQQLVYKLREFRPPVVPRQ